MKKGLFFRNRRSFATIEEANRYTDGYDSFPRWPTVGLNGTREPADQDSLEAMGYYDAEQVWEEAQDRKAERYDAEFDD